MIQKEYLPLLKQTKAAIESFAQDPSKQKFDEETKLTWVIILAAITGDNELENGIEKDFYVLSKLIEEEEKEKLFETTPTNIAQLVEAMEAGKLNQAQARERMAQHFQKLRKVYIHKVTLSPIPEGLKELDRNEIISKATQNPAINKPDIEAAVDFIQSLDDQKRIGIVIESNLANPSSALTQSLFSDTNIDVANKFRKDKEKLLHIKTLLVAGGISKELLEEVIPTERILVHSDYEISPIPPNQSAIAIERTEILRNDKIDFRSIHTTTQAEVEKYNTVDPNILRKSGFSDNLAVYAATFGNRTAIAIADKKIRESDPDVADAADLHRRGKSSVTLHVLKARGTSSARLDRIATILDRLESRYSLPVARTLLIQSGTLSSNEVAALAQGTYMPQVGGIRRIFLDVSRQFLGNPAVNRVQGLISEKKEKIISGLESQIAGFAGRKSKGILSTVTIKAAGWIAAHSGLIGTLAGGAAGSVFGPVGLAVGASLGAAAGGIGFGAQIAAATAFMGTLTFKILASIAVPLAIIFVAVPLFVALTLFIINSGAYVVPGGEALVGGNFGTLPTGCPAQMWPLSTNRGETYTVTQGPGGKVSHGPSDDFPNTPYQEAIDIGPVNDAADTGSVLITHPGIVKVAGTDEFGGNYVEVIDTCGGNFRTSYAHMLNLAVKVGDTVKEGSLVGQIGNTGFATATHVHYSFLNADPGRFNGTVKSDPNRQKYPPPFMVTPYIPKTVPQECVISQERPCRVDVP